MVPSDVIWEGWGVENRTAGFSWRGKPLDYVPYLGMGEAIASMNTEDRIAMRVPHDDGRAAYPETIVAARIPVEDIEEPVFLLGGMADQVWASGEMAINIAETRNRHGLDTELFIYDGAGHGLSGPATLPSGRAEAKAKQEAFPALLDFFERTLR